MEFENTYEDPVRAKAYSKLEFPGTYFLAFRDLPEIFARHGRGRRTLDLGCGSGRSTRFLRRHGFSAIGADISDDMIRMARGLDPAGDYRRIDDGDLGSFPDGSFDLVLSMFTFDNVPTWEKKLTLFREVRRVLQDRGAFVSVVSSAEIYRHEWASFTTKDFPENRNARTGDRVRIVVTDLEDRRPVEDIVWFDEDYRELYRRAGLDLVERLEPLGRPDEGIAWVSETRIAPWVIYVSARSSREHNLALPWARDE
ncbi:MAG: methyltransferase domain-containing protein [Planctomycetes bacterium]|nr:methyltransferase domain-containing protein [Planctomycetota bacterium]